MTADGRKLETARITNSAAELRRQVARAGVSPRVVVEATYGWYWAADTLAAAGAEVHLAHPLGVRGFAYRRVKNDERDAADLADLLRMGRLPEAWIAPGPVRELRELTRYRHKLVRARTSCKDQVHAVLAKLGIAVTCTDIFGVWGSAWLDGLALPQPYAGKVASLRKVCALLAAEITVLDTAIAGAVEHDRGYQAVRALPGIGPVLAAVIVAEIGDIRRFASPAKLCCWAGLTPRHRESDLKVARGHITKMACAGGTGPPRRSEVCHGGGRRTGSAPGAADVRLHRPRHRRVLPGADFAREQGEPAGVAAPVRRDTGGGLRGRGMHWLAVCRRGTATGGHHRAPRRAGADRGPAGQQAAGQNRLG
jgi:transposase